MLRLCIVDLRCTAITHYSLTLSKNGGKNSRTDNEEIPGFSRQVWTLSTPAYRIVFTIIYCKEVLLNSKLTWPHLFDGELVDEMVVVFVKGAVQWDTVGLEQQVLQQHTSKVSPNPYI